MRLHLIGAIALQQVFLFIHWKNILQLSSCVSQFSFIYSHSEGK